MISPHTNLVEHLKEEGIILTPTRRLATRLKNDLNTIWAQNHKVWATPAIYALEDWLNSLWEQYEIQGCIGVQRIQPMQALLRWEVIIQQSEAGKRLLQPHTTAKTVFTAWKTLHYWRVLHLLKENPENNDFATFQNWAQSYADWLAENQYTDDAQYPSLLLELLCQKNTQPKNMILYGFEELTPLYQYFFEKLTHLGWQCHSQEPALLTPQKINRIGFMQQQEECKAAAQWAKALLAQNKKGIAIVTPHLTDQRDQIEKIFKEVLDPLHILQPAMEVNSYFNISTAIPFIQYPIIIAALSYLKLGLPRVDLAEYMTLMNMPFSKGAQSEKYGRRNYAYHLKKNHHASWSLAESVRYFINHPENAIPEWQKCIQNLSQFISTLPVLQTYSVWAKVFKKILHIIGWPGEKPLNSIEHQAVKRWDQLLQELGFCDGILEPTEFATALFTLQKLTANTPFQAENKHAPIQILGLLEAAGQHFDYLWVMGLDNEAWPPAARPNPFIPMHHQRAYKMPHASPEREMAYACKVTQRLMHSAPEIILSYPTQDKEKILEASELIKAIPEMLSDNVDLNKTPSEWEQIYYSPAHIENVEDDNAPALSPAENMTCHANTLALQAACPFKAFAEIRLEAKRLPWQTPWLQPYQQGILLHRIVEKLWHHWKDQKTLLDFAPDALEKQLDDTIAYYVQKNMNQHTPVLYAQVERLRLKNLLQDYLQLEKQRPPFAVIATEKEKHFNLNGLHFKIRLDRVDQDAKGNVIIIDYKTGNFDVSQIWGERPKAPQLPLYYLAEKAIIPQALMVIKLQTKKCAFEGVTHDNVDITGLQSLKNLKDSEIPLEWEALNAYWTQHLGQLTHDFQQGQAQVDPIDKNICNYCDLGPFCRIAQRRASL